MKKIACIILFAVAGAFSISSCTEETITPNQTTTNPSDNGGGGGNGGKI